MKQVLDVSGLTFRHSSKKRWLKKPEIFSLGPIDMQVTKGETIAIIGQNRSGKSLLAKMLAGAVEPDEGNIHLMEEKYWSVRHRAARKNADITGIRMIFQHSSESLNPGITTLPPRSTISSLWYLRANSVPPVSTMIPLSTTTVF